MAAYHSDASAERFTNWLGSVQEAIQTIRVHIEAQEQAVIHQQVLIEEELRRLREQKRFLRSNPSTREFHLICKDLTCLTVAYNKVNRTLRYYALILYCISCAQDSRNVTRYIDTLAKVVYKFRKMERRTSDVLGNLSSDDDLTYTHYV